LLTPTGPRLTPGFLIDWPMHCYAITNEVETYSGLRERLPPRRSRSPTPPRPVAIFTTSPMNNVQPLGFLDSAARMTPLRRRVLSVLLANGAPMGAYDVLRELADGDRRANPVTAYRALYFLEEAGFIRRIDRLNAFIACSRTPARPGSVLVCRHCSRIVILDDQDLGRAVGVKASENGFTTQVHDIEIKGTCSQCNATATPS
jgi:Fur family transcriptional regulator, zinc uptake regulator